MTRLSVSLLVTALMLLWTGAALADDTAADVKAKDGLPWDKGEGGEAAAEKQGMDLEKELGPMLYRRAVKPIEDQMEQAKKFEKMYEEEMAKPEDKRNVKKAETFRERAAATYVGAILKAKRGQIMIRDDAQKAAVKAQYQDACTNRAAGIYADMATARHEAGDLRGAAAYYQKIQKFDPENEVAKNGLEALKKEAQQKAKDAAGGGSSGGGAGDNERTWGDDDKDWEKEGREDTEKDWTKTGREDEGWKKGGAGY